MAELILYMRLEKIILLILLSGRVQSLVSRHFPLFGAMVDQDGILNVLQWLERS